MAQPRHPQERAPSRLQRGTSPLRLLSRPYMVPPSLQNRVVNGIPTLTLPSVTTRLQVHWQYLHQPTDQLGSTSDARANHTDSPPGSFLDFVHRAFRGSSALACEERYPAHTRRERTGQRPPSEPPAAL
eukprot:1952706-Rhodomonas_salina.1